jgi:hypothetical protein
VQLGYGVQRPRLVDESLLARAAADAAAWQPRLPKHSCFGALTAAILHGWWLPPMPPWLPVFVAQTWVAAPPQHRQLVVTRHRQIPETHDVDGLRVAAPGEALLGCARFLGLLDTVVLVDGALDAGVPIGDIRRAAAQRRRGAPRLRQALLLCDARAESAWETMLRVFHESVDCPVTPQFVVRDDDGSFLARGDLRVRDCKVLHEYDGESHLERRRQRTDLRRARRLGNSDWVRRGYTSEDLLLQPVTILRDIDLALGRLHDPSRVRAWYALLRGSLFTPVGTERLRARLGLTPTPPAEEELKATG